MFRGELIVSGSVYDCHSNLLFKQDLLSSFMMFHVYFGRGSISAPFASHQTADRHSLSFMTKVCLLPRQKEALARLASLIDCTAAKEPKTEGQRLR